MLKPWQALCFRKVPLFPLIGDLRVLRDTLGHHFGSFLGALGSILVVWEGPGDRLEFGWILGPSLVPWALRTRSVRV